MTAFELESTENIPCNCHASRVGLLRIAPSPVLPLKEESPVHGLGCFVLPPLVIVSVFIDLPVHSSEAKHVFILKFYVPAGLKVFLRQLGLHFLVVLGSNKDKKKEISCQEELESLEWIHIFNYFEFMDS